MKDFVSIFFACLLVCVVGSFFFLGLLVENLWFLIALVAFIFAVQITAFVNQQTRIEELEEKIKKLVHKEAE